MAEMMTLRQMREMALGEINSKIDQMEKGRRQKPPFPAHWFAQQDDILRFRRCVLFLIEQQIKGRQAESEAA